MAAYQSLHVIFSILFPSLLLCSPSLWGPFTDPMCVHLSVVFPGNQIQVYWE